MTRPEVLREQTIEGSPATTDLLQAFDLTLQQGTYEPSTLAPIARLLSAGDVVLQSNLAYWRYNTPRPQETWSLFNPPPVGIGKPVTFGKPVPVVAPAQYSLTDEEALTEPANAPWPPPIAVFPVSNPRPIYRAEPANAPLVIDGSGAGVVAAAATGLLNDNPTIFYAGTLDGNSKLLREVVTPGAQLVLTDSNRKVLQRWSSVSANIGETLPAVAEPSTPDPTAVALPLFAHARPTGESLAVYSQARYVTASAYGNPVAFTPEDRPAEAFDGNLDTAWSVAAFSDATGNWLQVRLDHPVTTDHISLVQVLGSTVNRWITRVDRRVRWQRGHLREPGPRFPNRRGPDDPLPEALLHDPSDHDRRHHLGGPRVDAGSIGGGLLRGSDPRDAASPRRSRCLRTSCGRWGAPRSRTASPS